LSAGNKSGKGSLARVGSLSHCINSVKGGKVAASSKASVVEAVEAEEAKVVDQGLEDPNTASIVP